MIDVSFPPGKPVVDPALLERAANTVLEQQGTSGSLSVVLGDDEQLQRLNRDYLGVDAPTDVLSFPASETDPDTGEVYLGDILISTPRAAEQAQAGGHALEAELQLLVVHGVLHLLGHDHAEPEQKGRMWAAQDAALAALGLAGIHIHE